MEELNELMEQSQADYTIVFRRLADVVETSAGGTATLTLEDAGL